MKPFIALFSLLWALFALPAFAQTVIHNTNPDAAPVSLGNFTTKTMVFGMKKTPTADTTPNHTLDLHTVSDGKTFYLEYIQIYAVLKNPSPLGTTTVNNFGMIWLESPATVSLTANHLVSPTNSAQSQIVSLYFAEPLPFESGELLRMNINPASPTAIDWYVNFGGYER
jgi:hypothetical protein